MTTGKFRRHHSGNDILKNFHQKNSAFILPKTTNGSNLNQSNMQKKPFNENGLQSILIELYALTDQELNEQAAALKQQPKLWINGHFELTTAQLDYLDQMPVAIASFIGDQGSFAIGHRLPVTLNKEGDATGDEDKLFKPKSNLTIETDNEGKVMVGGDMSIDITYFNKSGT